jgi:hypothetical protein
MIVFNFWKVLEVSFVLWLFRTNSLQNFVFQGPVELAAVGVSISVFNLVSKMFNIPLLNITTSFVAEDAFQEDKVIGGSFS